MEIFRLLRFGCVGLLAGAVYYSISVVIASSGISAPLAATIIGNITAAFVSYFGHLHFSFVVEPNHRRFLGRFLVTAAIGLCLNIFLTLLLLYQFQVPYVIVFAIVTVIVAATNYLTNRLWVFFPGLTWRWTERSRLDAEGS
jgi:putative flippase GtrA